jgi:hypothetical protein
VLEVYQGYLLAGKVRKKPRCLWINKQNIEGLAEVAKIVAIESAFSAILSFIPGGSFAYQLIKDQIGYPPRYNVIFEPDFYKITYSIITLDNKGQPEGVIDGLVQSMDHIAKIAIKTGSKVQDTIKDFLTGNKTQKFASTKSEEREILGFTYLKFEDYTSVIRNKIVDDRLNSTKSIPLKLAKTTTAGLAPSIIISFKTTENEKAIRFLNYMQKIGFDVNFSKSI